ncbi:MAG: hypothetical protein HYX42_20890 [Polaromonas sp.]|nr:hypothetical protein [Polaromonas sp.]MBI2728704.1 hypothetical protein [Polaromonas sp.]
MEVNFWWFSDPISLLNPEKWPEKAAFEASKRLQTNEYAREQLPNK